MTKQKKCTNADEYIATFDSPVREILEKIRQTIRSAVPGAEEVISYNVPAYKYNGSFIMYFSGLSNHVSVAFYPTEEVYEKFKPELAPYKKSKSTVQIQLTQEIPYDLITKIAKFKASRT